MKIHHVRFYYQGMHSYKGLFEIHADNETMAEKMVKIMIDTDSPIIPQNWDTYRIYDVNACTSEID